MNWPLQSECDEFYGNPRSKDPLKPSMRWETQSLVRLMPPFKMTYIGIPITKGIRIHKKCHDSLGRVLAAIWDAAGRDQKIIDKWQVSLLSGTYNYRPVRGSKRLSMHAYGCAIDLDYEGNTLGDRTPEFATRKEVLAAFEAEGWEWGGRWNRADGMHWQAARTK